MAAPTSRTAPPSQLVADLHDRDQLSYHMTQHLRMNGMYWGLTALSLLGQTHALPRPAMLDWVMSCYDPTTGQSTHKLRGGLGGHLGAFAPHPNHEPHLHPTLSAIQILATHDALHLLDHDQVVTYILSLQSPTGAFAGDEWGEQASRFTYCAVSSLSLLDRLHDLDVDRTVSWIQQCRNFDGGFGMCPGAESHAAYVWTCLGTLAILDRLDVVDKDTLCWWLCERQLPCGGLNGRPEKLEDVCYSWWALASLAILKREHWIDADKLKSFILSAQDPDQGGIADRPEDLADVWHTVFGIAGLSLLSYPGLEPVDPIYCMPFSVTNKLVSMRKRAQVKSGLDSFGGGVGLDLVKG